MLKNFDSFSKNFFLDHSKDGTVETSKCSSKKLKQNFRSGKQFFMFRKKFSKTKREKTKRIDEEKEIAHEDRLTNYFLRADKKNCGHCER